VFLNKTGSASHNSERSDFIRNKVDSCEIFEDRVRKSSYLIHHSLRLPVSKEAKQFNTCLRGDTIRSRCTESLITHTLNTTVRIHKRRWKHHYFCRGSYCLCFFRSFTFRHDIYRRRVFKLIM